ncbi:Hypothetical predicted protein [Pelobates cultripes]|uniref:Uncharacterized protein n=1 Tax=Pelobates cultripes TaxID=61616 RepID=A0AAD1VUP2_PELCU|nr:Hypothetical predicted protein [Pelobates cultripes]
MVEHNQRPTTGQEKTCSPKREPIPPQWRDHKRNHSPPPRSTDYKSYSQAVQSNLPRRIERRNPMWNEEERRRKDDRHPPVIQRNRSDETEEEPHISKQESSSTFFRKDPVTERLKQTRQITIWESPGKRQRSATKERETEKEEERHREKRGKR